MSPANLLTLARFLLLAPLWVLALSGQSRLVGCGLVLAGLTDVLDGYLARRLGQESLTGARLEAIADSALLISAAAWVVVLHPEVARDNRVLLGVAATVYGSSLMADWLAFGRLVDPRQVSSKVAGGLLYAFALITFLTGDYEPLLLRLAVFALLIASIEGVITAIRTIHVSGIMSMHRSHAPQAEKEVESRTSASASTASSAIPTARDTGP